MTEPREIAQPPIVILRGAVRRSLRIPQLPNLAKLNAFHPNQSPLTGHPQPHSQAQLQARPPPAMALTRSSRSAAPNAGPESPRACSGAALTARILM